MTLHQTYQLCSFFLQLEADMIAKSRPNIAKFARKQHQRYSQRLFKEVERIV